MAEFESALGRPHVVAAECGALRRILGESSERLESAVLRVLSPLLQRRGGDLARPLGDLLESAARQRGRPWALLRALLMARDTELCARGLRLLAERAATGPPIPLDRALDLLAALADCEAPAFAERSTLAQLGPILRGPTPASAPSSEDDPIRALLRDARGPVRRLAARILDAEGADVSAAARLLLDPEALAFLEPYLAYTKATHLDVVDLGTAPGRPPAVLVSLRKAAARLGEPALRDVLAEVGWSRASAAVDVVEQVALSFDGSLPILASPAEATLLARSEGARVVGRPTTVIVRGARATAPAPEASDDAERVRRFRAYGLLHADVLHGFLDFAALTRERALGLIGRMDRIVGEHLGLFATLADECAILPDVYAGLRERVLARVAALPSEKVLDADSTRLVLSFEDPPGLADVRTLHALKRYLHQRSLQLASRLLSLRSATDRTVDLLRVEGERVVARTPTIHWTDLRASRGTAGDEGSLPHAIAVLVDAFARQLAQDHTEFPAARVFLYGTEAHYYLSYWTHPAFVRVDYSPPLRGGLVDLEYFGVSKSTLGQHPAPSLDAIRHFLRGMEFDVEVAATRVHARYDKERARHAGDISAKAGALFRLAPYLMDLDWIVGSLRLDADARRRVVEAWERSFAAQGVLPLRRLLTAERTGILQGYVDGPTGRRSKAWTGAGPYADRFTSIEPKIRGTHWAGVLSGFGLGPAAAAARGLRSVAQLDVERAWLRPLREAVARGKVHDDGVALEPCDVDVYHDLHETELFAEMLDSTAAAQRGVRFARLVAPLERSLRFSTTGSVQGYEVQRARLELPGATWGVFVLRDATSILRLAAVARDVEPCRRRRRFGVPWESNVFQDVADVAEQLREANLFDADPRDVGGTVEEDVQRAQQLLAVRCPVSAPILAPGSRVVAGVRASSGRAVGRARLGGERRAPEDVEGCVLFVPELAPRDYPLLQRSAAIVSTGGSALSHVGLVANQLGKPALVADGAWRRDPDGSVSLAFDVQEWLEEAETAHGLPVTVRHDLGTHQLPLRENDLVVVDADAERLEILGQERQALALHDDFRRFLAECAELAAAHEEREVLTRRGRCLRTQRRLEEELATLRDGLLACYAVHEILAGPLTRDAGAAPDVRQALLQRLLDNPAVAEIAREHVQRLARDVARRERTAREQAARRLADSDSVAEVVLSRLDALHASEALASVIRCLGSAGPKHAVGDAHPNLSALERTARLRLHRIRGRLAAAVCSAPAERLEERRHDLAVLERIDELLGASPGRRRAVRAVREALERRDAVRIARLTSRSVLDARDGGGELACLVGAKAANLGEIARILGPDCVPTWFAVTDAAFRAMLASAPDPAVGAAGATLGDAVRETLARRDLDPGRQSAAIRTLFESVPLPRHVEAEVERAYRALARPGEAAPDEAEDGEDPWVAVRSSSREEDLEAETGAGEFETYLWVRGMAELSSHVRRVWAGLWTERAIRTRASLARSAVDVGGGVIVQCIVRARVSGVVQTIDVAAGETREIVINAGLGLGEGVVSGAVAADDIRVVREAKGDALRFRYVTRDKTEQVVFDRRAGFGTTRMPTKYHQRLRPALEYVEVEELSRAALALEAAWGCPLDIEFAYERSRLRLLQARPVAAFFAALRATRERYPFAAPTRSASDSRKETPS